MSETVLQPRDREEAELWRVMNVPTNLPSRYEMHLLAGRIALERYASSALDGRPASPLTASPDVVVMQDVAKVYRDNYVRQSAILSGLPAPTEEQQALPLLPAQLEELIGTVGGVETPLGEALLELEIEKIAALQALTTAQVMPLVAIESDKSVAA